MVSATVFAACPKGRFLVSVQKRVLERGCGKARKPDILFEAIMTLHSGFVTYKVGYSQCNAKWVWIHVLGLGY